jgi:CheY-like chemotaxis protein
MAQVQQGALTMQTAEAEGTSLCLRLPALPAGVLPEHGADAGPRPGAAAAETRTLPALRVLVVDDDEFNLAFVRGALPSPPLQVATAINGRAAVDAVRSSAPDLIFMDIEMPVMNGFEALAQIRQLDAQAGRKAATVIAFSSYDDEAMRRQCREAGFDAYLSKPAPRDRIHEMLYAAAAGQALPGDAPAASVLGAAAGPDDPVQVDPDLAGALPRFLQTRRALLADLRSALQAGDREQLRKLAHKLAGSFALYRFDWAAAASRALQAQAASSDAAALLRQVEALQGYLERVKLQPGGEHERTQENPGGG